MNLHPGTQSGLVRQHFPQYVFFVAPHHTAVPFQSSLPLVIFLEACITLVGHCMCSFLILNSVLACHFIHPIHHSIIISFTSIHHSIIISFTSIHHSIIISFTSIHHSIIISFTSIRLSCRCKPSHGSAPYRNSQHSAAFLPIAPTCSHSICDFRFHSAFLF